MQSTTMTSFRSLSLIRLLGTHIIHKNSCHHVYTMSVVCTFVLAGEYSCLTHGLFPSEESERTMAEYFGL